MSLGVQIEIGSVVVWRQRPGYWKVTDLDTDPTSHSAIPILRARLEPIGERWNREGRYARLTEIKLAPPDLEDFR